MKRKTKITKKDFARLLASEYGYTIKDATNVLDEVLCLIEDSIMRDYELNFSGFGKFYKNDKKAKKVTHPMTKEVIEVGGYSVMSFKCSEILRDKITGNNN